MSPPHPTTRTTRLAVFVIGCGGLACATDTDVPEPTPTTSAHEAPAPVPMIRESRVEAAMCGRSFASDDTAAAWGAERRLPVHADVHLILRDCNADGESHLEVRYADSIPDLHLHLIELMYYESRGWMLLDDRTDTRYHPSGPPLFSPDSAHFVAARFDLHENSEGNALEVWAVLSDSITQIFGNYNDLDWGPRSIRWADPRTVKLWQVRLADTEGAFYDSTAAYLTLTAGRWQLTSQAP